MATKTIKPDEEKTERIKVDKLQVKKGAMKDLSDKDAKDVKGGLTPIRRIGEQ